MGLRESRDGILSRIVSLGKSYLRPIVRSTTMEGSFGT